LALPFAALFPSIAHANIFAEYSAVMDAFGISWLQVAGVLALGLLLLAAISTIYAFVFRFISRKVSSGALSFTLRRGTVFFALVPLLCTVLAAVVAAQLRNEWKAVGVDNFLTILATVGGTAGLARPLLLQVKSDAISFLKVLGITLLTFVISGGFLAVLRFLLVSLR
jgi:hypothetical protein